MNNLNKKKKISFDMDGTLDDHFDGGLNINKIGVQNLLIKLSSDDLFDVYVITRRYGPDCLEKGAKNEHLKVFQLLNKLNIELPKENVLFTNREYKYLLIDKLEIDIHLDDDVKEHELIKKFTNRSSVNITLPNWENKFDELL